MQIKRCTEEELGQLAELWLRVSLKAHHFIDSAYWIAQKTEIKERYLPLSETYVGIVEKECVGFISMVENYLAALFIEEAHQQKGYGYQLLERVKQDRDTITLKAFVKNESACRFYTKQGFVIEQEQVDPDTNEREYILTWRKNQGSGA